MRMFRSVRQVAAPEAKCAVSDCIRMHNHETETGICIFGHFDKYGLPRPDKGDPCSL